MTLFPWWSALEYITFGASPASQGQIRGTDGFSIWVRDAMAGQDRLCMKSESGVLTVGDDFDNVNIDGDTITLAPNTAVVIDGDFTVGGVADTATFGVKEFFVSAADGVTVTVNAKLLLEVYSSLVGISKTGVETVVRGPLSAHEGAEIINLLTVTRNDVGANQDIGLELVNTIAATAILEQRSPATLEKASGWNVGGAAAEDWRWLQQAWSVSGTPSVGVHTWWAKRGGGAYIPILSLANNGGVPGILVGDPLGTQYSILVGGGSAQLVGSSVINPTANGINVTVSGESLSGTGAFTASQIQIRGGNAAGAAQTTGSVIIENGQNSGAAVDYGYVLVKLNGSVVGPTSQFFSVEERGAAIFRVDRDGMSFFAGTRRVQMADLVALTDNIAGVVSRTLAAIPDPADAPATADALRDDLVANTLPALRDALSSLADFCNDMRDFARYHGLMG